MGNGERGTGGPEQDGAASFLERLVERWAEQGIRSDGGAGEDAIRAFEGRHGVRMPEDLRAYFRHVGGVRMDGESPALDQNLIRFWRLEDVETLASSWVPAPDARSWFVIADYSIWVWAYVIRLTADQSAPAPVAVSFGAAELLPVADSFGEFVGRYLRRDPLVISPDQEIKRG
jgi:hypothetical protein